MKKIEGDASVAVVRGTKRYLFDLSAELEYEVVVDESFGMDAPDGPDGPGGGGGSAGGAARQATYRGTLSLPDLTHDLTHDATATLEASRPRPKGAVPPAAHRPRVDAALTALQRDLRDRCLGAFAAEFQTAQ